jgi:DNA-binding transcriptional LysR family regulator
MLDATRLRVLVAIARYGSVTAAAHALNYAQPSISHHMAKLEAETGAKLMERAGRGVRLTEAGWLLAGRAEEIIGRLDAAEAELAAHVGLRRDRVRLAAFGSALATLVAAAVTSMRADPVTTYVLATQAEPADALPMLRAGAVDVALTFKYMIDADAVPGRPGAQNPPRDTDRPCETKEPREAKAPGEADLRYQLVLDEPLYLVTPAGQPTERGLCPSGIEGTDVAAGRADGGLQAIGACAAPRGHGVPPGQPGGGLGQHSTAGAARVTSSALGARTRPLADIAALAGYSRHRWIAGCDQCRDSLVRLCHAAGFTANISISTDDYVSAQAFVAAGLGVTILPELALHASRHPAIAITELSGARRLVHAVTYGDPPAPPATTRLIEALKLAAA